jgi:hypothetical protein
MNRAAFAFRVFVWLAGGFVVGLLLSDSVFALKTPQLAVTRAATEPRSTSAGQRFTSDAGIVLKFIKADRVADFEATVEKLKEALSRSGDPERREQAQSWRVFKAVEPATNGDAVYVFEFDPAVRGADYTIGRILAEAFPAEAESLYRRYADASSSRQHVVDLKLIAVLGGER